jgi:hypothetical protein
VRETPHVPYRKGNGAHLPTICGLLISQICGRQGRGRPAVPDRPIDWATGECDETRRAEATVEEIRKNNSIGNTRVVDARHGRIKCRVAVGVLEQRPKSHRSRAGHGMHE